MQTMGNPFQNELTLQINATTDSKTSIRILNSVGSIQIAKQVELQTGKNNVTLPTAHLPSGLYIVSATDGTSLQTVKVIKE